MSFNTVDIYYGPCDSFHTVTHKPQKLRGLKDRLQKLGYRIKLVPVIYINYCILEICGHEVFRCNIQNLCFNTPYHQDPVCQRAIEACLQATVKLTRARTYFWLFRLVEDQMFLRSPFGPKDYWYSEEERRKPFTSCLDCVACCGILVQKKSD